MSHHVLISTVGVTGMSVVNPLELGADNGSFLVPPSTELWRVKMLRTYSRRLLKMLGMVRRDNSGVTAIEYGLIAGAIAVVIIGAVTTLGTRINERFEAVRDALPAAAAPAAPAPGG
jgi:pilus assembly protein Flp/PilA